MVSKIRISSEASSVVSTCSRSFEITNWIFYIFKKILFSGLTKRKTIDEMNSDKYKFAMLTNFRPISIQVALGFGH